MQKISVFLFVFSWNSAFAQIQILLLPIQYLLIPAITDKYKDDELYQQYLRNDTSIINENLNDAFRSINLAIKQNTNDPDLYLKRAFIRRKAGLYSEASSDFDKSLELAKSNNKSSTYKDSVLLEKIIILALTGKTENCIERLDSYISRHPKSTKALLYKGLVYFCFPQKNKKERYQNAINCFDDLLYLQPNLYEIRLFNGVCYSRIKDYHGAISEYSKVIELDKNSGIAYYSRAKAFLESKQIDRACSDFHSAEINNYFVPNKYKSKSCN